MKHRLNSSRNRKANKEISGRGLVLFGIPFLLAGLAISFFLGVKPFLKVQDAKSWVPTPATILSSEVRTHRGSDSTTYSIQITFAYSWEGTRHTSNKYNFSTGSSSGRESKARVVRAYPVGHQFKAFVNPNNPSEAVINPAFQWIYLLLFVFGSVFWMVGLGVMIAGARSAQITTHRLRSVTGSFLPTLPQADTRGNILLKPNTTPWGKVFGLLAITLFWNGIISVFLFQVWKSWQQGSPDIFLTLFMIPFVLIGIGLLLGFVYSLLAAFNPRVLLLLSPSLPQPGSTFSLDWEFLGPSHRLKSFSITLEGLEHITYTTGSSKNSSTHTHERFFYKQPLMSVTDAHRISPDSIKVQLPADLPHSFDAPNNKILWRFILHGKIQRWPDLKQTFPLVVLPQSGN